MNKHLSVPLIALCSVLSASNLLLVTGGVSSEQNMLHLYNIKTAHISVLGDSLSSTDCKIGFAGVAIQPKEWLTIGTEWYQEVSDFDTLGRYIPINRYAQQPTAAIVESQARITPNYGFYAQASYLNLSAGIVAKNVSTEMILLSNYIQLQTTLQSDFKPQSQWATAIKLGYTYQITNLLDAVIEIQRTLTPAEITEHQNDAMNSILYGDKIELSSLDVRIGARVKLGA